MHMPKPAARIAVAAVGLAMLTSCGGDSSSGGAPRVGLAPAPTPTPSPTQNPTPTPAPTPSPTATPLAGPAALTQIQDFAILAIAATGTTSRSGSGTVTVRTDGVAFRYLAAAGRHEMMIPNTIGAL